MSARRKNPAQLVILGNPRRKAKRRCNGAPGHKPTCDCAICKNMRAAGRNPSARDRGLSPTRKAARRRTAIRRQLRSMGAPLDSRGAESLKQLRAKRRKALGNASGKWMAAAFSKHPGKLHKRLGVPENKTIPLSLLFSKLKEAKRAGDTELEREILLALNARRYSGRKKNPDDQPVPDEFPAAVAKYEEFHGRGPDAVLKRQRSAAMRAEYVSLGPLLALAPYVPGLALPTPDHWPDYPHLKFEHDVKLATNAEGTQLYAIGGNQDCSAVLSSFEGVDKSKDIVTLGELAFVVYLARKKPDPSHPTEYMHRFDAPRPELGYDQLKAEIFFIGGRYEIREWIEH